MCAWKTRNHIRNTLCPDSTPIYLAEGKTTNFAAFRFKFGQTVITKRIGVSKKHITSRNELGIVVCPVLFDGTVLVYLPERGHDFVAPRADVRALMVGAKQPTLSVQDGQKYMPAMREDGTIGLVTRGDTGFLSQKYILDLEEREDEQGVTNASDTVHSASPHAEEFYHPSLFGSSLALDDVLEILEDESSVVGLKVQTADVHELRDGEHIVVADEVPPLDTRSFKQKSKESNHIPALVDYESESRSRRAVAKKPSRYANAITAAYDAYNSVICSLLYIGTCMILNMRTPNICLIMSKTSIPIRSDWSISSTSICPPPEVRQRNPTWGQALKGSDREKWLAADEVERKQHFEKKNTFKHFPGGRSAVPRGNKVLPLKRHCKIKDDGTYKIRWVALGNLDDYDGDTFAPTASKKVVWLIFAVALLLSLTFQWYDIGGAFMAEKPTRVVYVEIDKEVYILLKSLYGLTDAPKVFNDGLVEHLVKGGYVQSKWDK